MEVHSGDLLGALDEARAFRRAIRVRVVVFAFGLASIAALMKFSAQRVQEPASHASSPVLTDGAPPRQERASSRSGFPFNSQEGLDSPTHNDAGADARQTDLARGGGRSRLDRWLREIAAEAGLGLVVAPGLDSEVFGSFRDGTSWREKLESLSRVHDFEFRVGEQVIEVMPDRERTGASNPGGWAPIDRPLPGATPRDSAALEESAASTAPERSTPRPVTRVLPVENARAAEMAGVLRDGLRRTGLSIAADPASNSLVASGAVEHVATAERIAARLDVVRRRFLLEAMILEIASSARTELGVQWRVENANLGAFVDFPAASGKQGEGDEAGIVVASSGSHNLRARISALEAGGHIRVVSRPTIVVVEGKPASIESVRILRVRFPDRAALVTDSEDVAVGDRAVEAIPVGVRLRVEPALQGRRDVILRIRAESSTLGPPLPPDDIPEELSRVVDAEIVVADGETAVLGGLLQVSSGRAGAGVPWLGRMPLVGLLFGRRRVEREERELLVLVTPHLLPAGAGGPGSR